MSTDRTDLPGPYAATPSAVGGRRVGPAMVVAVGGAALLTAVVWPLGSVDHGPDICVFRAITGLPCPGCGLTRSWVHLMHGDVGGAFSYNVFGPLTLVATVIAVAAGVWCLVAGPGALKRLHLRRALPVLVVLLGVWLVYGVARIVDAAAGWGVFPAVV